MRIILLVALLCSGVTHAAEVVYIHAGQLLDQPGQPPRGPTTIIVRDGKIAEVRDGWLQPRMAPD